MVLINRISYLVDMHDNTPSAVIAKQIRIRRRQLGLNREQLASECAAAGVPGLTAAALTNIETGRPDASGKRRREVSAEELLVLSYALRVHPVDLVVPGDAPDDAPYAVAPNVSTTAGTAREWIAGYGFLSPIESVADMAEAVQFMPEARAGELMRRWWTPEREQENIRQVNRWQRDRNEIPDPDDES